MKSSIFLSWSGVQWGTVSIDDEQSTCEGLSIGFLGSIESSAYRHNPDWPWVISFRLNGTSLLALVSVSTT